MKVCFLFMDHVSCFLVSNAGFEIVFNGCDGKFQVLSSTTSCKCAWPVLATRATFATGGRDKAIHHSLRLGSGRHAVWGTFSNCLFSDSRPLRMTDEDQMCSIFVCLLAMAAMYP